MIGRSDFPPGQWRVSAGPLTCYEFRSERRRAACCRSEPNTRSPAIANRIAPSSARRFKSAQHRDGYRRPAPQPREYSPSVKKTKVACVQHHDVGMIFGRVLSDGLLWWPENALPGVRHTGIVEDRTGLHQCIPCSLLLGSMQFGARMKRSYSTLRQVIEYFDHFHLGHTVLGKQERSMTSRFGCLLVT
ncbi:hypothetical protein QFZ89_005171 [Paraburkholderia youngii]